MTGFGGCDNNTSKEILNELKIIYLRLKIKVERVDLFWPLLAL